MSETVLITGASGLVGTRLTQHLQAQGYTVTHLSRRANPRGATRTYRWDPARGYLDPDALATADHLVHLAGAGIADQRWTDARKRELLDSRVETANLLFRQLQGTDHRVRTLVSASAIGYYGGDTGDVLQDETSPPGDDFLAEVCLHWEAAAEQFHDHCRVVKLRIGVVLSGEGGALPRLVLPIRFGLGAPLGHGKQYLSWIHLDDLCGLFAHALRDPQWQGAYNAVGPAPVTNAELTRLAARVLRRPLWLPHVPAFALRAALGEMATVVLGSSRVANHKAAAGGYAYRFADAESALRDLLGK